MKPPEKIIVLTKSEPDYGGHSSYYTQAFRFPAEEGMRIGIIRPGRSLFGRMVGKVFSTIIKSPPRDQNLAYAEFRFLLARLGQGGEALCHIAAIEDHLPLLRFIRRPECKWIGTVHFPPSCWSTEDCSALANLGTIVTLCERDRKYFQAVSGAERVVCIPHGVEVDYFCPALNGRSGPHRLLFVGKWLRDFDMAGSVLAACLEKWKDVEVDIVVARRWTAGTKLDALHGMPRVSWLENVSDDALRSLYQQASLLVMPLKETSANNAIVEALACGLVPVVNNVGGISDYGGGGIYPLCQGNDREEYLRIIGDYLASDELRSRVSRECRQFAKSNLNWRIIRSRHLALYREIAITKRL